MVSRICPEDKKNKSDMVCKHRHYTKGKFKSCKHFKGADCAHPNRYLEEKK